MLWGALAPVHWALAVPPDLVYEAPDSCPSEASFLQAVAERSGPEGVATTENPATLALNSRAVRAVIEEYDGGWRGRLVLGTRGGGWVRRDVEARDCKEVFDAMVLMTALARDAARRSVDPLAPVSPSEAESRAPDEAPPLALQESGSTDTPQPQRQSAPSGRAAGGRVRGTAVSAPRDGSRPDSASLESSTHDEPRTHPVDPLDDPAHDSGWRRAWPRFPEPASVPGWAIGAAATLRSELSPQLSPGAEVVLRLAGRGGWYLRGALGGARSGKVVVGDVEASFAWLGASFDGCMEAALSGLSVCASYDGGMIAAKGADTPTTDRTDTRWRSWAAVGPAVRFRLHLVDAWELDLGVATLYTVWRPRFLYGGMERGLVHEPSAIAFAATAGAQYSLGYPPARGSTGPGRDIGTTDGRRRLQARLPDR